MYAEWQLQQSCRRPRGPAQGPGAQTHGTAKGRWPGVLLYRYSTYQYCTGTLTVAHRALAGDHLKHWQAGVRPGNLKRRLRTPGPWPIPIIMSPMYHPIFMIEFKLHCHWQIELAAEKRSRAVTGPQQKDATVMCQ